MKLICCYNVVKGGGVNISINFAKFCLEKGQSIFFLYPGNSYYEKEVATMKRKFPDAFSGLRFPVVFNHIIFKVLINYVFLPILVLLKRPDAIYNFGNVAFPTFCQQFLLMHNAFATKMGKSVLGRFKFKDRMYLEAMAYFIRVNLRFASVVGVQTQAILEDLSSDPRNAKVNFLLVPNFLDQGLQGNHMIKKQPSKTIRLLFLSKYYPHKNFEILIPFAKKVIERGHQISVSLTLDPKLKAEDDFLKKIRAERLYGVLKNIGYIASDGLKEVYNTHNGLLLPTLLESFSGTYIESFAMGVPVFTSDRNFAREICQDAAFYFDPENPEDILDVIMAAFNHPEVIDQKIANGYDRLGKINVAPTKICENILLSVK